MSPNIAYAFTMFLAGIGVPLLAAHAFLRFQTIRMQVSDGHVFCHPGWPKELPIDVTFARMPVEVFNAIMAAVRSA